jgi:hypothetical protein
MPVAVLKARFNGSVRNLLGFYAFDLLLIITSVSDVITRAAGRNEFAENRNDADSVTGR